jgi:hypothetical protein
MTATTVHRPTPEPAPSRAAQRKQCAFETEQPLEDTELEVLLAIHHSMFFLVY